MKVKTNMHKSKSTKIPCTEARTHSTNIIKLNCVLTLVDKSSYISAIQANSSSALQNYSYLFLQILPLYNHKLMVFIRLSRKVQQNSDVNCIQSEKCGIHSARFNMTPDEKW